MAAVTERSSRRSSQIKTLLAVLITILSVKVMTGDARHPSLAVQYHIRGDPQGRHPCHRMRPYFIGTMIPLMARDADVAGLVAQRRSCASQRKMVMTIEAAHREKALMGCVFG
jgi:hypothetical protein